MGKKVNNKRYYLLDFKSVLNNKGFGYLNTKAGNPFTPMGTLYPIEKSPESYFKLNKIPFKFQRNQSGNDNIEIEGQEIKFEKGQYKRIFLLGSSVNGDFYEDIFLLIDGVIVDSQRFYLTDFISVSSKFNNSLAFQFPYVYTRAGKMENIQPKIWQTVVELNSAAEFNSILFGDNPSMHVFSITLEESTVN